MPEERLRDAFTPEAREERHWCGEYERQQRTAAIERAFRKQSTTEEANDA
jgi:hypothetical protein